MAKKRKGLDGWSDRGNEKEGGGDEGGEGGGAREEDQGVVEKGEKRARVTEEGEGKGEGKGERETA